MKKYWGTLGEGWVNVIRPPVFANHHFSLEVSLLLSHRDWEIGALSPMITFKNDGSQVFEKDIPEMLN